MRAGEIITGAGEVELNPGRDRVELEVRNTGDRPIQVGSHYHFAQANDALDFDRTEAFGMRLDVPAGSAVRFEPGITRTVTLVGLAGRRVVAGLTSNPPGRLDAPPVPDGAATRGAATGRAGPCS